MNDRCWWIGITLADGTRGTATSADSKGRLRFFGTSIEWALGPRLRRTSDDRNRRLRAPVRGTALPCRGRRPSYLIAASFCGCGPGSRAPHPGHPRPRLIPRRPDGIQPPPPSPSGPYVKEPQMTMDTSASSAPTSRAPPAGARTCTPTTSATSPLSPGGRLHRSARAGRSGDDHPCTAP